MSFVQLLCCREKQRGRAHDPDLRERIRQYHESLIHLRGELSRTPPNAPGTLSIGTGGKLIQEGIGTSADDTAANAQLIGAVILKQQAVREAIVAASAREGEGRVRPSWAALLEKMDSHATELSQLQDKAFHERIRTVSRLIERARPGRRRAGDPDTPDGLELGRWDSREVASNPTMVTATRHRR